MNKLSNYYKNKKILITGHTGFKGAWLSLVLSNFGAKILGISKNIPTTPSLYAATKLNKKINTKFLDIKDLNKLKKVIKKFNPDIIFHLAAQSLVKKSFLKPVETFSTNSIGTLNILESIRDLKKKCNIIIITSDKCYENREVKKGYKETDRFGGKDPYSASKASAEIILYSYFNSFIKKKDNLRISIARAGNVVGGGDWSDHRLVPDIIKSWSKNKTVNIRNLKSTRPWQHVLEAIFGYLLLCYKLNKKKNLNGEAFNFGPSGNYNYSTKEVLEKLKILWPKKSKIKVKKNFNITESTLLKLNCTKAKKKLSWVPILNFNSTFNLTISWYINFYLKRKKNIYNFSKNQIDRYLVNFLKKNRL